MATVAFLLIVTGVLLVYGEFIWVGKLVFGVIGAVCTLVGVAMIGHVPHALVGIWLISASIACFAIEARFKTCLLAGITATLFWGVGFWRLCPEKGIPACVAFPVSGIFGAITIWLFSIAKRARWNKTA